MSDDDAEGFRPDEQALRRCAARCRETGESVTEALVAAGAGTEGEILGYFARRLGVPLLEGLDGLGVPAAFTERVPVDFARRHGVVAVSNGNGVMSVATSSPLDFRPLDDVAKVLGAEVRPALAPREEILALLDSAYGEAARSAHRVSEDLDSLDELVRQSRELLDGEDLLELAGKPPIVRLVNRLLLQALELRASDIHFRPREDRLQVRFRVDGVLHEALALPRELHRPLVSRIKVMGRMDVAERRLAQDGRSTVAIGDREVDLRIASLPTSYGEQVVVRALDREGGLRSLGQLGMEEPVQRAFRALIGSSHGIILATGPTGSGKTTTLYAALGELDADEKHILTLEDPIEYQLPGVSQTQVNYKKGLTFASGLRSVLRQDPDVILVGEIRDIETARMAIQSALTGHLVLSTLHTNDALTAITRLVDLGVAPYLVSSSVIGVLAQRLVRKVCDGCRQEVQPAPGLLDRLGIARPPGPLQAGQGCQGCLQTGYLGRTGVFELLVVDQSVREAVAEGRRVEALKPSLVERGLRTLRMDGIAKAARGTTTLEEVARVTQRDDL